MGDGREGSTAAFNESSVVEFIGREERSNAGRSRPV